MSIEENLEKLQIVLPDVATPLGSYRPCVVSGNHIYVSGQLPLKNGELIYKGTVGDDVTLEEAVESARTCAVNLIAVLRNETGDLNRVKKIVKVTGYVASAANFYKQADVLNGASNLFMIFLVIRVFMQGPQLVYTTCR